MKNLGIIIAAVIFSTTVSFAQSGQKGPAAKNYKPWQHKHEATKIVEHDIERDDFTGPKAKNYKAKNYDREILLISTIQSSERKDLQGPRAKNYKPWKKQKVKDSIEVPMQQPMLSKQE